jgi:hypothetical protein
VLEFMGQRYAGPISFATNLKTLFQDPMNFFSEVLWEIGDYRIIAARFERIGHNIPP